MTSEHDRPSIDSELRRLAEEIIQKKAASSREDIENLSPEEIRRIFHELRVHQIELEMQNVQLRETQVALEASQARYFDLYDLAPVGYCTVGKEGLILEANLKAATMLGLTRMQLVGQPISPRFIHKEIGAITTCCTTGFLRPVSRRPANCGWFNGTRQSSGRICRPPSRRTKAVHPRAESC